MAARPDDRYPGARELGEDVRRYLDDEPVTAWREPLPTRARRWAGRRRTPLTAAAVALVVAAAGGVALAAVEADKNAQLWTANVELDKQNKREVAARSDAERYRAEAEENAKRALAQIVHLQELGSLCISSGFLR